MSITATVKNDLVKLPEGVHLPDGTRVRLKTIDTGQGDGWPSGYFERTAGALAGERFERPAGDAPEQRLLFERSRRSQPVNIGRNG
jgi:hypothetical protein